jgi:hypothetical protein
MNRRSFFKFLPIAPVALVADGARAASSIDAPAKGQMHLTLQGSKPSNRSPNSLGYGLPESDPTKQVSLSIGQDGNLWLKSKNGEWKRVMTDG